MKEDTAEWAPPEHREAVRSIIRLVRLSIGSVRVETHPDGTRIYHPKFCYPVRFAHANESTFTKPTHFS